MRIARSLIVLLVVCGDSAPLLAAPCAGFTDVDDASGFCADVAWIKNRNITLGCTATTYCPNDAVSRLQMAAFLHRLGDALFPLTCSSGQVMKWNGTAWACANDAGATANAFVQGGNAFGATARAGTLDAQAFELIANSVRALRLENAAAAPNVIGGHASNSAAAGAVFIGGGGQGGNCATSTGVRPCANQVFDQQGAIAGGRGNQAGTDDGLSNASQAVVGGGSGNTAAALAATIAGGALNHASGQFSTVPGGLQNVAGADQSFAAGSNARVRDAAAAGNATGDNGTFVWSDTISFEFVSAAANEFAARATGGFRFVTDVDPGTGTPTETFSIVPGGFVGINTATPESVATVTVRDPIAPTLLLKTETQNAAESGRIRFAEMPASGNCLGAYIHYDGDANLLNIGTHPFGDCVTANDVAVIRIARTSGRIGILTTPSTDPLIVGDAATNGNGAHLTQAGVWTNASSRAFKENFADVDADAILAKVSMLPVRQWTYRGHDELHIGPTAEDFRDAFGLGASSTHIGTVDIDGVALAAIQALAQRLGAKEREAAAQRATIEALEQRLRVIEARLEPTR